MHSVELHKRINQAVDLYYRLGFWHRGDVATARETSIKLFYSIYYLLFVISVFAGAIQSDNDVECIILTESAIMLTVVAVKLLYLIWRKREIIVILHRLGVYPSIKDQDDFNLVNEKINRFLKFMTFFYSYILFNGVCTTLVAPLVGNERKLFLNIGFPLDYKTSEFAYWIAFGFFVTVAMIALLVLSFSILIWFLLLNCCLKYQVLGNELRNMGVIRTVDASSKKLKTSKVGTQNLFSQDLITAMDSYANINKSTQQLESFLSNITAFQLAFSAVNICASIYCLAFLNKGSLVNTIIYTFYLSYNILDIFMVLYFGNEIKLFSDRLSYCLFESNWIDQPQACKKCIIIFGERLKQPYQLVILKIYPATLETFTTILNSAYGMFNILKSLT